VLVATPGKKKQAEAVGVPLLPAVCFHVALDLLPELCCFSIGECLLGKGI